MNSRVIGLELKLKLFQKLDNLTFENENFKNGLVNIIKNTSILKRKLIRYMH